MIGYPSTTGEPPLPGSRLKRHLITAFTAVLTATMMSATAGPALAYSGSGAASYADQYALHPNTPAYPVFSADCTNFVSQAAHAGGGYPFRGAYSNASSDKVWWIRGSGSSNDDFSWSNSWAAAYGFYSFLLADQPGGHPEGTAPGSSIATSSRTTCCARATAACSSPISASRAASATSPRRRRHR